MSTQCKDDKNVFYIKPEAAVYKRFKEVYPDLLLNEKSLRMELLPNDSEASRRVKLTVPGVGGTTKEFIARDQIDAANELNESLVRTRNERYCFDGDILDGFTEYENLDENLISPLRNVLMEFGTKVLYFKKRVSALVGFGSWRAAHYDKEIVLLYQVCVYHEAETRGAQDRTRPTTINTMSIAQLKKLDYAEAEKILLGAFSEMYIKSDTAMKALFLINMQDKLRLNKQPHVEQVDNQNTESLRRT